jgi:multisubunit Na+/H+ antiporter MnhF subunit
MADMIDWRIAAIALVPPLAAAVLMCARGSLGPRLAAVQLLGTLAVLLLVVMTFAFTQASSMDLALTLALLTLPATLLYALFVERWL